MVNRSSTAWLNEYQNSDDPGERALAKTVASAIQRGSLGLGKPASQTVTRALYGQHLETTHGAAVILAHLGSRNDGRFDLIPAAMRDSANPNRKVTITARANASTSEQAQLNPASLPPYAAPLAPTPLFPSRYPATPQTGPSSQPLQRVVAAPAFSPQINRSIGQIVNGLIRWDQNAARAEIAGKLRSVPPDEKQTLLMYLTAQLSGKASDTKPAIIRNWAATATVDKVVKGRDMRTEDQKQRDKALAAARANPAFEAAFQAIKDMMPDWRAKQLLGDTHVRRDNNYSNVLFSRVFADSRGPAMAIEDIRTQLEPLHPQQRYYAIKKWRPR